MNKKTKQIEVISRTALDCIEKVASSAEEKLQKHRSAGARVFAAVNALNDTKQVDRIGEISAVNKADFQALVREPVICRVSYVDEDDNDGTIFVTRGSPQPLNGLKIASYRTAVGKIAAIPAGEEFLLPIGGQQKWVTVRSSAKLQPRRKGGDWDSWNNEIEIESLGKVTVVSLRALLEPAAEVNEDILKGILDEDEPNILEGIRRGVLSHMGLRDHPILDKYQDEIFRLPIDSRCFLSGPPGTGKTTTLIRRIGQKLDLEALEPPECALVERAGVGATESHEKSWIMFSPTELLRQYVKEAFAKEGIAASDDHIKTWTEYRKDFARNVVGILRTSRGRGQFIVRANEGYLDPGCGSSHAADWYEDFNSYFRQQLFTELSADTQWLSESDIVDLADLGSRVQSVLHNFEDGLEGAVAPELAAFSKEIKNLLAHQKAKSEKIVNLNLNRILHGDRSFLDKFAQEIGRQAVLLEDAQDDEDDIDSDFDDDEEGESFPTRTVSRRQARARYERVIRVLARAKARSRKLSDKTHNGQLFAWLGDDRVPRTGELEALARIIAEQSRLRKIANIDTLLIRGIARLYKKFRRDRAKEGRWYKSEPVRQADICWKELDLVILAILKMAGSIFSAYGKSGGAVVPEKGALGNIRASYKNQVLVDEATDFSVIQLAIMHQLTHPAMKSFFACGDFNQRLTEWGITNNEQLDWVDPYIERHEITVSYRQSGRLVALAKQVAKIGGSQESDIVLPDRLDSEGVAPVWATKLDSDKSKSAWLASRIREIEQMVGSVPSIAILVNDEARVEPLATRLNEELQQLNLNAAACKDGKVVGSDQDVRVFDIQHIKGMEFEAVFFVDLDDVIATRPDLYAKYLYVGATRAATYLGVTFKNVVPDELVSLKELFEDHWSL